jgi:hypothetical protein
MQAYVLRMRRLAGLALLYTLVLAAPAAASFPDNSAVLLSSDGDPAGQAFPHLYTDNGATFSVSGTAGDVFVHITGSGTGLSSGSASLEFAARPGTALKPGLYKNIDHVPGQTRKGATMDLRTGGSCNRVTGWFEVKDIATDANGFVQRLQVLYEQHCDGAQPALYGELRYGEPVTGNAVVTPSEVILPSTTFGAPTNDGVVALLVANPFSIASATFTGRNSDEFAQPSITACCGSTIPDPNGPFGFGDIAGAGIEFTPQKIGTRTATLNIADSTGASYSVPVSASTVR